MREKTNVYFLAEITRGFENGDCILLENIHSNGNIKHALIDTGRYVNGGAVCKFLEKHKVQKLEFLCITHSHGDHNGDALSVLNKYKVDLLIMKEFDLHWSTEGAQSVYEKIVVKAIEKDIKILGISFESLGSSEYSPTQGEDFKSKIQNAKKEKFEYFNKNNITLEFGSADIKVINWEIFDTEGNLFVTGQNIKDGKKVTRDIYAGENENSLGILLFQGNKKAFFAGDMGNIKKNVGGIKIGDEDRLKYEIGKIDFLKFGHHGYSSSNTTDYMTVIFPDYGVITNDIGYSGTSAYKHMENNKKNFLYSTQDEYEVCAIIYNDDITLGFGSPGLKKVRDDVFYIPENKIYSDYLKCKCNVKYDFVEKSVNNWEELKATIEQFKNSGGIYIKENCYLVECLKIYLNIENNNNIYNANSTININNYQNIHLISKKNEIIIKRDEALIDSPLFRTENGFLTLGEENMEGKITIDGNKENVTSSSNMIQLRNSIFTIYNNVTLCNHLCNITKIPTDFLGYGSTIVADRFSYINMYGGEISNNIQEMNIKKNNTDGVLPEILASNYFYDVRGTVIYLRSSTLNVFGGKICNNKGINNSEIYSNENSTNGTYSLNQRILGGIIFADSLANVNLYKGEISDNYAVNNSKSNIITSKKEKTTNIDSINSCIYGSLMYFSSAIFKMNDDFIITNNSSNLNTSINIEKNCIVKKIDSAIRGGQIYCTSSTVKINGGIIQNAYNKKNITSSIESNEGGAKNVSSSTLGGAMDCIGCKDIEINNLKVKNCNGDNGGGLYFDSNCNGIVSNSELSYNTANYGGGIYISNNNKFILNNIKILNNLTKLGSGGGVYAYGDLTIDGEKSSISNNIAETWGGGIMIKTKTTINNCIICNNKAMKNSGGGIQVDGELYLNKAKIYKNWCNENGGGISCLPSKLFISNKDDIDNMVYNNKAEKKGDNLYPLN